MEQLVTCSKIAVGTERFVMRKRLVLKFVVNYEIVNVDFLASGFNYIIRKPVFVLVSSTNSEGNIRLFSMQNTEYSF